MSEVFARPAFGGKARPDDYYRKVDAIIATLRPTASQRTIAAHLNKCGFTTPHFLPWDRQRLANYLRGSHI